MTILYKNNASTTLGGTLATGALTLTVVDGSFIPAVTAPDVMYVTLQGAVDLEIVKITSHVAAATTMVIVRSQDGTTDPGTTWPVGTIVECRVTAGELSNFETLGNVDVAAGKTTPVDADYLPLKDSAAASALKQLTWASLKAVLQYSAPSTGKTAPVDADSVGLYDSAAATTATKLTWANLKAVLQYSAPSTGKTTPVDADSVGLYDSAATTTATKLTWANLKATFLATKQSWTKPQRPHYLATDAVSTTSSYTYDGDTKGQINLITLTNAITVTFAAPTTVVEGQPYTFMLKAGDTSARTFAWNAAYQNTPPTTGTIISGKCDVIHFIGGASNTLIYSGSTVGA